jgi:hypothetical protein
MEKFEKYAKSQEGNIGAGVKNGACRSLQAFGSGVEVWPG